MELSMLQRNLVKYLKICSRYRYYNDPNAMHMINHSKLHCLMTANKLLKLSEFRGKQE